MGWFAAKAILLTVLLLGLPLAGLVIAGRPILAYLEFPPQTRFVSHAPFSWIAFGLYAAFIAAVVTFAGGIGRRGRRRATIVTGMQPGPFPWWGWAGFGAMAAGWVLAWTRFQWFAFFQPHTFVPLWLAYIVVVNALCQKRSGRCPLIHRTGFFLTLFPASAAFWWFFEYLNRFVQNWYYTGAYYGPWMYFFLATLSFATVLPAVLSTHELVLTFAWVQRRFAAAPALCPRHPKRLAILTLALAGAGLAGIGVWPDLLFALLWVAPLLLVTGIAALAGQPHVFSQIGHGDWRQVAAAALAALICGFCWEMWNYFSLARWTYAVPYVQRFHLFEMPLLGFAGYLPFGLECLAVVRFFPRPG